MEITNIRYFYNQGYPTMEADIDGKTARFIAECKPTINAAGIVFLGPEFTGVVPEIEFQGTQLRGYTKDPKVFSIYDRFGKIVRAGRFSELVKGST